MYVDKFLGFSGFSMKFDEDVLKMMKKRKRSKKMKFSMNFWVWSLCGFCFFILVPQHMERYISVICHITASSFVCHIDVFVKDDDGKDQTKIFITYRGCFITKKDTGTKTKNTQIYRDELYI